MTSSADAVRVRAPARARPRPTARAALLVVLVTGLALAMVYPFRELLSERDQVVTLQRQEVALEQANAKLKARLKQLKDPDYLERLARECLGMVRPGEIGFVTVPDGGAAAKPIPC